jgi:hypothetical protein
MKSIRAIAKKIPFLSKTKNALKYYYIKRQALSNPVKLTLKTYYKAFGRKLDLDNPKTLNEKLNYLKLFVYWDNPTVSICADKFRVREFIRKKGCEEILNGLLGCWEKAEDINWSELPEKFAIKCNPGSGFNLLCTDKSSFDIQFATKQLNEWLKVEYGMGAVCECGIYRNIRPLIIAERFIETEDGLPPKDYKFFCSFGKCKFLFVASERVGGRTKFDYYWPDWKWIDVRNCHPNAGPKEKPQSLEKMIAYAEKLSEDFPLVRVDLYEENGQIYFGELTFTHFGCVHKFDPDEYDYTFGKCFPDKSDLKMN